MFLVDIMITVVVMMVLVVVPVAVFMPVGAGALQHKLVPAARCPLDDVFSRHSWKFGEVDVRVRIAVRGTQLDGCTGASEWLLSTPTLKGTGYKGRPSKGEKTNGARVDEKESKVELVERVRDVSEFSQRRGGRGRLFKGRYCLFL